MTIANFKIQHVLFFILLTTIFSVANAKTITFSNLIWQVREGFGNPGPNSWADRNVWTDERGWLHLKINYEHHRWNCPLLYTDQRLGFGRYWFVINGPLDQLDPNAVLALFNYPTADIGTDETNEIDIEISRWGSTNPLAANLSYTVWPSITRLFRTQLLTYVKQQKEDVTHGFVWSNKKVFFFSADGADIQYQRLLASWLFAPSDYLQRVPQSAMPIYISLYLLKGTPPVHKNTIEIIIKQFCYVSFDGKENNCHINSQP